MNCVNCGSQLTIKNKRVRAKGSSSCLFELIGILIIIFTFWTIIGIFIGLLVIGLGHNAAYEYETIQSCRNCNSQYLANNSDDKSKIIVNVAEPKSKPATWNIFKEFFYPNDKTNKIFSKRQIEILWIFVAIFIIMLVVLNEFR